MRPCDKCGRPISPARLVARPDATLCVRCKARNDEKPKRAWDLRETLAVPGELTPGEVQRMIQRGG